MRRRRRLRVTDQTLKRVAEWRPSASPIWRERMADLLRSMQDGSWEDGRWYPPAQYSSDPDIYKIDLDKHLHVFLRIEAAEDAGGEWVGEVFEITVTGLAPDQYDEA